MSKINDSLKRVKMTLPEGMTPKAPPPSPTLEPLKLRESESRIAKLWLPMLIVVALGAASFFLWQWYQTSDTTPVRARVTTPHPTNAVVKASPVVKEPRTESTAITTTTTLITRVPTPAATNEVAPKVASPKAVTETAALPATNNASQATNVPAAPALAKTAPPVLESVTAANVSAVEPVKPEPPSFKLQGIFYDTKNPSAMINGQTVFTGDSVAGARVTLIEKDAVTIVTPAGETQVLGLP